MHGAIRGDAIDDEIAERIRLDKLRDQPPALLHVGGPSPDLFNVLIDATAGGNQGCLRATASVQTPEVTLLDEVVNQLVPQSYQFFQFVSCPDEIRFRQSHMYSHAERGNVFRTFGRQLGRSAVSLGNDIRVKEVADQGSERLAVCFSYACCSDSFQSMRRS